MLAYRPDIDGLRAISVALVVIYHAFPESIPNGYLGVDVFFVISGYLITGIILGSKNDSSNLWIVDFYIRRIRRIFPALVAVLAAVCIASSWLLLQSEINRLGLHLVAASTFTSNFVLYSETGYFDAQAQTKPLLHLWSLAVEEQFYLIWPLLIYLAAKLKSAYRALSLLTVAAISLSALSYFMLGVNDKSFAFYMPFTRGWQLLSGAALFMALASRPRKHIGRSFGKRWVFREAAYISGLLILIFLAVFLDADLVPVGLPNAGVVVASALMIAGGRDTWSSRLLAENKLAVGVGRLSYPLYLWHWPLLSFLAIHFSGAVSWQMKILAIGLSIALSWLTWKYVEHPFRFGWTLHRRRPAIILCCAMFAVGIYGYSMFAREPSAGAKQDLERPLVFAGGNISLYLQRTVTEKSYVESLRQERRARIRAGVCHLNDESMPVETFLNGRETCLEMAHGKLNVIVVGDSHAADLFMAIQSEFKEWNVLQSTAAGCLPFSSRDAGATERCKQVMANTENFLRSNAVQLIVLAGRWQDVPNEFVKRMSGWKEYGVPVVLVGPPAEYSADVESILPRLSASEPLDDQMGKLLRTSPFVVSKKMAELSAQAGFLYVDRVNAYCPNRKCPVVGPDGELYIRDYGHLTAPGAIRLGNILRSVGAFSSVKISTNSRLQNRLP